jgi:hypothetical protein
MRPSLARLALLLAGSALGVAQQLSYLSGVVQDTTSSSIPEAAVALVNEETGFRRTARTNQDGGYAIPALQPGIYKVTVRKEGFRTVVRFGVKLDVAQPARVDFTMPVGAMHETITVEGSVPLLNSDDASVGALVSREMIERLPLNGRNLLSLIELTPGSVITPATRGEAGQFSVNGQRPNTNYFTVDGVSVNSGVSGGGQPAQSNGGSLPGMTAFGSFHGIIPLDALDEFRVQTSSSVPEFGRLPGAQITLSSRSGSNEFHGSLFHYFRNEKLEANDWFANRAGLGRALLRLNDYGGSLGGPFVKNRLFFFVTGEDVRIRQPLALRTPVPDFTIRATAPEWVRPILNFFPPPNGDSLGGNLAEWSGRGQRPASTRVFSGRLDAAITSRLSAFGRYNLAPSATEFGYSQINALDIRSWSATGGLSLQLGPSFANDFRVATSDASARSFWRQSTTGPLPECMLSDIALTQFQSRVPCDGFYRFSIAGVGQLLYGPESDNRQSQWHVVDNTTVSLGSHQLRFGADYRRLTPSRTRSQLYFSVLADSLADFVARRNLWITQTPLEEIYSRLHEVSLYAQDTFRLNPSLTVTYGLRWELNPPPLSTTPASGSPSPGGPFPPATEQRIWKLRYNNIAPRVGLAWRLDREGRLLLRAGFGIFYDSSLALATDIVNGSSANLWQFASPAPDLTGASRTLLTYSFSPDLRLPLIREWNVTLERALTRGDVLSGSYIGSSGRRLLRREIGGVESQNLVRAATATNNGSSDFHSFQLHYRRRLSRIIEANASYAWSHSIDTSSADATFHWVGRGLDPRLDRASSDFDVRHSLNLAFTYTLRKWALDGIFRARTGFPINILNSEYAMGVTFANIFRPDLTPGQPIWLNDASAPGGKRLNPAAFTPRGELSQGNLGRNALNGFGMHQWDIAARREFSLSDRVVLQLRLEAFNLFNHPNMADPIRFLASPLFGQPVSMLSLMLGTGTPATGVVPMFQIGGPRSAQLVLRLRF